MRIDVSGEYFGVIGSFYDKKLNKDRIDELQKLIHTSIEVIDNYLSMIYNASKKQKAINRIGEALSDKLFIRGLDIAVDRLNESINFDKMLFLYYQEERETLRLQREYPLNYVYYNKKERIDDSSKKTDSELKKLLYKEEKNLKSNKKEISDNLIQKLGLKKYIEMSMIYGTNKEHLVGKIIVSREDKEFNTTQRDILSSFSTLIRQRISFFMSVFLAQSGRQDIVRG
jgi:hypothetical protein